VATVVVGQCSLFEAGEPVARPGAGSAPARRWLGQGAWVDVQSNWLAGSGSLFDHLLDTVPWRSERRPMYDRIVDVPRLVAFFGEGEPLPAPALDEVRDTLSQMYGHDRAAPFRTVGLCLYRTGSDSVAWHGDTIGRRSKADTLVAIVSLGEPRRFLLRPKAGGPSHRFNLGHGDLLVMGGSCQRTFEHSVPKTRRPTGPRLSLQFRSAGVR
jgi:alkylated DNA repair dioxygenase AlkB